MTEHSGNQEFRLLTPPSVKRQRRPCKLQIGLLFSHHIGNEFVILSLYFYRQMCPHSEAIETGSATVLPPHLPRQLCQLSCVEASLQTTGWVNRSKTLVRSSKPT